MTRKWNGGWGWLLLALTLLAPIAPLASGARTLFLRDVLRAHLAMRASLGDSIRSGELPLVDPRRAGGQGLVGNPNAVALYPDNLLLLVASTLWQLNAHFWMHWLLAFTTMAWLARRWGLSALGALAAAAAYGWSGFFVSQLNLYNAIAVVAWTPALAACVLGALRESHARRSAAAAGAVWALMLLGGDPQLAGIGAAVALALALAVRTNRTAASRRLWLGLGLALVGGTLVAAPQLVELARLLPGSYRGYRGYGAALQSAGNPRPEAALELLLPLFFGRPDLRQVWSQAYFGGQQPLYFSLAPGVLMLALAAIGVERRDSGSRSIAALAALFTALAFSGGAVGSWLANLPGGGLFRYSVKLILGAAVAASLLAGRGLERALADAPGRSRARLAVGGVFVLLTLVALAVAAPGTWPGRFFGQTFARGLGEPELAGFRRGWSAVLLIEMATLAAALLALALARRRPAFAGAALVGLHAVTQLLLLRPLLATDEAALYRGAPTLLAGVAPKTVLAHGGFADSFVRGYPGQGDFPDNRAFWMARRMQDDAFGFPALLAGRRMELALAPDGLDAFPAEMAARALSRLDDPSRIRLLAASGVDLLILPRALADPGAELAGRREGTNPLWLYRLPGAVREAELVGAVRFASDLRSGISSVIAPDFDPRRAAVVGGEGRERDGAPGTARIVRAAADLVEIEADSPEGGLLLLRRAWLAIWRAEIDGAAAPTRIANVSRLAVEVPAGPHRVRFFVDRRPFRFALVASLLGVAGLLWMGRRAAVVS